MTVRPRVTTLVVMGAAGAGKTTVGRFLASRHSWEFFDADDFHSPANVAKMHRGESLTDADRAPWLEQLRALLSSSAAARRSLVLACSALKERYRQRLVDGLTGVRVVYLRVGRDELARRLAARSEHFFPPTLLDSQLTTLEEPADAIVVDGEASPERIVEAIDDRAETEIRDRDRDRESE